MVYCLVLTSTIKINCCFWGFSLNILNVLILICLALLDDIHLGFKVILALEKDKQLYCYPTSVEDTQRFWCEVGTFRCSIWLSRPSSPQPWYMVQHLIMLFIIKTNHLLFRGFGLGLLVLLWWLVASLDLIFDSVRLSIYWTRLEIGCFGFGLV